MSKIIQEFIDVCERKCDKVAFIFLKENKIINKTFSELKKDVEKVSLYLSKKGLKKGGRILVFIPPSYDLAVLILSSFKLGVSVMYVDVWASRKLIKLTLEKYDVDFIAVSKKTRFFRLFFGAIGKIKNLVFVDKIINTQYDSDNENIYTETIEEETVAILTMTSGSTGQPKIVIRTHQDLYNQLELVNNNMYGESDNDIVLTTAFMYSFSNILKGFTTLLPQIRLDYPFSIFAMYKLIKFRNIPVTTIITTPDFCFSTENIFKSLKKLYIGGAILNYNEANKILNDYNGVKVEYIYGATECNLITKIDLYDYRKYLEVEGIACLGKAVKGVNLKIGDCNAINVSSKALLINNLSNNKITVDEKTGVAWHNTGDVGYLKNDSLYYLGRNDVKIVNANKEMYSNPIEQKIVYNFPFIYKCAFFLYKGKNYLFLNATKIVNEQEILDYLCKLGIVDNVVINCGKKIPCDSKHHSKIDYRKLKKYIDRWGNLS